MKKRKRDREQTTAMIKQTSIDVFSKYGFDNATTRMIAVKCKVAESLIIRYFKNKNGLLMAITQDFIEAFIHSKKELNYEPAGNLEDEIVNYTIFTFENILSFNKTHKIIIAKSIADKAFSRSLKKLLPPPEPQMFALTERIDRLILQKKASSRVDAISIDQEVTFHIFGFYLIGAPFMGLKDEQVKVKLIEWATAYARGLLSKGDSK